MQLTTFPRGKRYTLLETELFAALPQDGAHISTKALVYARLQRGPWDIRHPRNVISTVMNKLIDKVDSNGEPFLIRRMCKPNAREFIYWLEPRGKPARARLQVTKS